MGWSSAQGNTGHHRLFSHLLWQICTPRDWFLENPKRCKFITCFIGQLQAASVPNVESTRRAVLYVKQYLRGRKVW